MIETARTSTLEQQTATVYAQGGKGFARLIAWDDFRRLTKFSNEFKKNFVNCGELQ